MRRGQIALLSAICLAGVGTAQAQLVNLGSQDGTLNFADGNTDFISAPLYWTGDDSTPVVDYSGPTFEYAGVNSAGAGPLLSRAQNTAPDRTQIQTQDADLSFMMAFVVTNPAVVGSVEMTWSTYAAGGVQVGLTDQYLILHTDGAATTTGWYAALLDSFTGKTGGNKELAKSVTNLDWYDFNPVTVAGTNVVGTLGASVPVATVLGAAHDRVGIYVEQAKPAEAGQKHNHFMPYFAAYELEAKLNTTPSAVAMTFADDMAIMSNAVAVSYDEGPSLASVDVTSITLVNADPGFSVSPASLVLTDPAPNSETVQVVYDNNVGGMSANGMATADLQMIWNEVGSATSATSTVPVSATYLGATTANIIAAFYSEQVAWKNANAGYLGEADIAMPDVDTAVSGIQWASNTRGSDDTSYGSQLGNAPVRGGAAQGSYGNYNDNKILIALTNNSAAAIELESVNFDYGRAWGTNSQDYVTVTIDGDLDLGGSLELTNVYGTVQTGDSAVDLNDCDVDLTGLADVFLEVGEVVTFEFQLNMMADIGILDNVAVLGKGTLPALVNIIAPLDIPDADTRWVSLGVTGLEEAPVSQPIDLIFGEGELMTNVIITGVSITDVIGSGMSGAGPFPVELPAADVTNSAVFDLVFDNSVANLAPGERTEHVVTIEFTEPGRGPLTADFIAYGIRPDTVPEAGILVQFDTDILVPDTAYTGLLGAFTSGRFEVAPNLPGKGKGSLDNTYGTLLTSRSEGTNDTWCILMNGEDHLQEASLVITNTTTAAIELSELRFDMGRWYEADPNFSLDVSGDVTAANLLAGEPTTMLGWNNHDFDDFDITLTNLADRTLAAGESVTFTWTYEHQSADIYIAMFIDNVALIGDVDAYGGWSASEGLTEGVNDGPNDNPDGDNKDNLMEYASGGDPLVADGAVGTMWHAEDTGTNWMYYVHGERQDDSNLDYGVGTKNSLVFDLTWDMGDAEQVGETSGAGLWQTVTNRTEMTGDEKFMGLGVEMN